MTEVGLHGRLETSVTSNGLDTNWIKLVKQRYVWTVSLFEGCQDAVLIRFTRNVCRLQTAG